LIVNCHFQGSHYLERIAMARPAAGEINKSEKIREYLGEHRRAKPAQVVEALAEQGVAVNAQYVSMVRGSMKKRKKKRGPKAAATTATAGGSNQFSLNTLVHAKRLADQLGGVTKAKEALDALARLQ
jgi:hypothetical protein